MSKEFDKLLNFGKEPEIQENNIPINIESTPTEINKTYNLNKEFPELPQDTINSNVNELLGILKKRKLKEETRDLEKDSPILYKHLQNPDKFTSFQNNIKNLKETETIFHKIARTAPVSFERGVRVNLSGKDRFFGNKNSANQKAYERLAKEENVFIASPTSEVAGQIASSIPTITASSAGASALAIIAKKSPQLIKRAGAVGAVAGLAVDSFMVETGHLLNAFDDIETKNNIKIDPYVKYGISSAVGLINASLEAIPFQRVLSIFGKNIKKDITKQATDFVLDKYKLGKEIAGVTAIETATETIQEVNNIVGEELVKIASDIDDPAKSEDVKNRLLGIISHTLQAFPLFAVPSISRNIINENILARREEFKKQELDKLVDITQSQDLAEVSQENLEEYLRDNAEGGKLYFQKEDLENFAEKEGLDFEELKKDLGADDIHNANISIPIEKFLVGFRANPKIIELKEKAQFTPNVEKLDLQNLFKAREKEEKVTQEKSSISENIKGSYYSQLRNAGRNDKQADLESEYITAYIDTLADKFIQTGDSIEQAYTKANPNITIKRQKKSKQKKPVEKLSQKEIAKNIFLEVLKEQRKPVKDKRTSLLQFIRRAGGISTSDELIDDIYTIYGGRKQALNIVRTKGQRLDMVREGAVESGYLEEGAGLNDLLSAIDQEVRGNKVFVPTDEAPEIDDGFEEFLYHRGLNITDDDNVILETLDEQGYFEEQAEEKVEEYVDEEIEDIPFFQKVKDFFKSAKGTFSPKENLITLFDKADASTVIHELGHGFLEHYGNLAEDINSPVKEEYEAILKYFGIESREQITTEHHEQFARGFEAYLRNGKAPSTKLKRVFEAFKALLTRIYKNIKQLNVELTKDLTDIFDRMLATQEEIEQAMADDIYNPVFSDPKEAGMTDEEYKNYLERLQIATEEAKSNMLVKAIKQIEKRKTKEYKQAREQTVEKVEKEIMQEPINQALYYLSKGTFYDKVTPEELKGLKLNSKYLVRDYGEGILKNLPRIIANAKGKEADQIAELFNFNSGDELINILQKTKSIKEQINEITDRRLLERFGDMLNDGTIEKEALEKLGGTRAEFLHSELVALGKKVGEPIESAENIAKQASNRFILEMRIGDINVNRFFREERKFAKMAQKAVADGNFKEAVESKRRQIFNFYLTNHSRSALNKINKDLKYLSKFNKKTTKQNLGKSGYLEQIEGLLEQYSFFSSNKKRTRLDTLRKWIIEQREKGNIVDISPQLEQEASKTNYKDLTTSSFFEFIELIKTIEHLSKLKNKLLAGAKKREYDLTVKSIVESIKDNHNIKQEPVALSSKATIKDTFKESVGSLAKPEFITEQLDGWKSNGAVWRNIFKPIADAENAQVELTNKITQELAGAFNKRFKNAKIKIAQRAKWTYDKKYIESIDESLTKEQRIAVALNWGNEGNRNALMNGRNWDEGQIQDILNTLEVEDIELVQDIWDIIDQLWQPSKELHRRLTGLTPEKVEASSFEFKGKNFKGGYYPLSYIRTSEQILEEERETQNMFSNGFVAISTNKGHLINRLKNVEKPVDLSLSVLSRHTRNVILDITHREALLDTNKLIQDPKVQAYIEGALGKHIYNQFRPWLKNVVGQNNEITTSWDKLFSHIRKGGTISFMGMKVTTALVQPLGLSNTLHTLGYKYSLIGLKDGISNLFRIGDRVNFALERSAALRNRRKTFDRDVNDHLNKQTKPLSIPTSFWFYHIGLLDMAISIPTWIGAYKKAMDGKVKNIHKGYEADAIAYADKIVRTTQSSGASKDLARVQAGNEVFKTFTMFFTYFSALYNQWRREIDVLKRQGVKGLPRGSFRAISAVIHLWIIDAILGELFAGRFPEEDEEWEEWTTRKIASYPSSLIPIARDVIRSKVEGYSYKGVTVAGAFSSLYDIPKVAYDYIAPDEEVTGAELRQAIRGSGFWLHIPTSQAIISAEHFINWVNNESDFNINNFLLKREN